MSNNKVKTKKSKVYLLEKGCLVCKDLNNKTKTMEISLDSSYNFSTNKRGNE